MTSKETTGDGVVSNELKGVTLKLESTQRSIITSVHKG